MGQGSLDIARIGYRAAFVQILNKLVVHLLELPEEALGPVHAQKLYRPELQMAVAYLVICESDRVKSSVPFLSRLFSMQSRDLFREHVKMLRYGNALLETYYDPVKFGSFIEFTGFNIVGQASGMAKARDFTATGRLTSGPADKFGLIRALVKKRVTQYPTAMLHQYSPEMVDQLPPEVLVGLPEGSTQPWPLRSSRPNP